MFPGISGGSGGISNSETDASSWQGEFNLGSTRGARISGGNSMFGAKAPKPVDLMPVALAVGVVGLAFVFVIYKK